MIFIFDNNQISRMISNNILLFIKMEIAESDLEKIIYL